MRQLNAYVKGRLRDRWHQRRKGWAPDQPDLVDHLMRSLEVTSQPHPCNMLWDVSRLSYSEPPLPCFCLDVLYWCCRTRCFSGSNKAPPHAHSYYTAPG